VLKHFIDEIINLGAFIIFIIIAVTIAVNIEDAGTVMVLIGISLLIVLFISTYLSYLHHKNRG
jgi:uncharacterized membrane protein YcaP (DUF421 family)